VTKGRGKTSLKGGGGQEVGETRYRGWLDKVRIDTTLRELGSIGLGGNFEGSEKRSALPSNSIRNRQHVLPQERREIRRALENLRDNGEGDWLPAGSARVRNSGDCVGSLDLR